MICPTTKAVNTNVAKNILLPGRNHLPKSLQRFLFLSEHHDESEINNKVFAPEFFYNFSLDSIMKSEKY